MTELDEEALLALYRAHQARVWTANIIGASESILAEPACTAVSSTHRRCVLTSGYTRLTDGGRGG